MKTTILETIHALFNAEENKGRDFSFNEIFDNAKSILADVWQDNNPQNLSQDKILEKKSGETYKLLTIDGGFVRHEDGTWSKRKINESL